MKRTLVIGLIAALLILVMVPVLAQDKADEKKADKKACCAKSSCQDFHACKNAKFEVVNTENGVTITITAEKAEDVKAIQECAAKCSAHAAKCSTADKKACCAKGAEKASCAKTCTAEQQAKCAAAEKEESGEKKDAGCQHGKEKKDA